MTTKVGFVSSNMRQVVTSLDRSVNFECQIGAFSDRSGSSPTSSAIDGEHLEAQFPLKFPGDPSKTDLKIYHSTTARVAARDAEYGKLFENVGATPCFFSVTS